MNSFEKIRVIRNLSKQTQTEFGESLGISKATVSNLEKGKVPLPPYVVILLKLLYNVDPDWLLDDSQSDFDKRFFEKDDNPDQAINPMSMDHLKALRSPYRELVLTTIEKFYEAQEKNDDASDK